MNGVWAMGTHQPNPNFAVVQPIVHERRLLVASSGFNRAYFLLLRQTTPRAVLIIPKEPAVDNSVMDSR